MKFIDKIWFTNISTIGIIVVEDEVTGERKAYIGTGFGVNEQEDINQIIDWGSKFPLATAQLLVKLLEVKPAR